MSAKFHYFLKAYSALYFLEKNFIYNTKKLKNVIFLFKKLFRLKNGFMSSDYKQIISFFQIWMDTVTESRKLKIPDFIQKIRSNKIEDAA